MEKLIREVWREIPVFTNYSISNWGRLKSRRIGRILKPSKTRYVTITLYQDGKTRSESVHKLVAEAFIPNPRNLPQINHIDSNKHNNYVLNLEWITASDNTKHMLKAGYKRVPKGKAHYLSRKVRCIETGEVFDSLGEAAKKVNRNLSTIGKVCSGKSGHKSCGGYTWEYASEAHRRFAKKT